MAPKNELDKYKKRERLSDDEKTYHTTSVNISHDQEAWLKKNKLNLSFMIRDFLSEKMKGKTK